ncbi:MAG: protein kinase [Verrucomicrobiota bacterium]|jgi:serine/threonine-protein kinase
MNLEANSRFSQYRIVRLLGRGTSGTVYEAEHATMDGRYALRLLPKTFAVHSEAVARFWREALVLPKLEHPHIVRVDEFGEIEGSYWLRMELVHGLEPGVLSLGDYAARRGGLVGHRELALILNQILEGLAYAHGQGVIHGNLRPEKILLERNASGALDVKISDFGLAWVMGKDAPRGRAQIDVSKGSGEARPPRVRTSVGDEQNPREGGGPLTRAFPDTWECLSPEQKRGEEADARSDIYAVGLMCFRLLTGKDSGRISISEPGAEAFWNEFLAKAIERKPAARYANGQAMLDSFKLFVGLAGAEVKNLKSTAIDKHSAQKSTLKQPLVLAIVTVMLFLAAISAWSFWSRLHHHKSERVKNLPPAVQFAANPTIAVGKTSNTPKVTNTIPVNKNTKKPAAAGELLVQTIPSGATVTLDGADRQTSPATPNGTKAGKHLLQVSLEGNEAMSREVEVSTNDGTNLGSLVPARKTQPAKTDGPTASPARYNYHLPTTPAAGDRPAAGVEFAQAGRAEQNEQLTEALNHYREAANLDPSWFDAQFNTGVLAHQLRDYPLALPHYELALAIRPDSVDARYNFALALQAAGYALDAADELKRLLEADPSDVRGHLALANLYARSLHDIASARQHYLKVLELDPKNPQASSLKLWLSANSP